jgi:predicted PurR-regulated permease PerM
MRDDIHDRPLHAPDMTNEPTSRWLHRALTAGLLGGLLWVGFVVMRPFMVAIAWAAILTCVSWPLHLRVSTRLSGHRSCAAFAMTVMLTLALGVSLLWLGLMLRNEGAAAVREAAALLQDGVRLPERIVNIPWLGPWLQERLFELSGDRGAWGKQVSKWIAQWGGNAMRIVGDLGLNSLRMGIALLTVFFLFRDGDHLLEKLRNALRGLFGERVPAYLKVVADTTRAVVYGLLLAALAQGLLAGLGYWVAGVKTPVFWGATTAVVALIPFGAPLMWGSIGLWLLLQGQVGAGIGLLLWGALAISWIDNLVRPLIISGVAKIPFLIVLYGVFGGLAAFGLVGLFVGPVILAVLLALWREWTATKADPTVCPSP